MIFGGIHALDEWPKKEIKEMHTLDASHVWLNRWIIIQCKHHDRMQGT